MHHLFHKWNQGVHSRTLKAPFSIAYISSPTDLLLLSWVYGSVTNNNGFWIGWFDLLTPSFIVILNHNQFTVTHNTSSAQFWSDLFWSEPRQSSLLVCLLLSSPSFCLLLRLTWFTVIYERLSTYDRLTSGLRMNYEWVLMYDWMRSKSKSKLCYDRRSVGQSLLE
jgi:hypothetical protein